MIDAASVVQATLMDAGYQTWASSLHDLQFVQFEDDAVMGFACILDTPATLLAHWRQLETMWLSKHAPSLHRGGDKSWNVYSVFLSAAPADVKELRQIRTIEEDLERTRKITGADLTTRGAVVAALLPLLPLQHQALLAGEGFDLQQRLERRIETIASPAAKIALDSSVPPVEVVRLLGGSA